MITGFPTRRTSTPPASTCTSPAPPSWSEIVSPGDETRRKLDFYHRAGVDPVRLPFAPSDRSQLLGLSAAELAGAITGPD